MLFRKDITPDCSYCRYVKELAGGFRLCYINGGNTPPESCIKFKYDPLKRKPIKAKALNTDAYTDADFSL